VSFYGAEVSSPNPAIPPLIKDQVALLLVAKTSAAARGDLKKVRVLDLEIKKLLAEHGVVHPPDFSKVHPPTQSHMAMVKETRTRDAYLSKYGVPVWFRTGYDNRVRAQLWLRLSRKFRDHLKSEHRAGKLEYYYPAPSFWAKRIKPSDYRERAISPGEIQQIAAKQGVDPALVEATVSGLEAQVAEVADIEQELAAEDVEAAALMGTLEPSGLGQLASEEKWYEDPLKIGLVAVVGLLFVSALK